MTTEELYQSIKDAMRGKVIEGVIVNAITEEELDELYSLLRSTDSSEC